MRRRDLAMLVAAAVPLGGTARAVEVVAMPGALPVETPRAVPQPMEGWLAVTRPEPAETRSPKTGENRRPPESDGLPIVHE